MNRISKHNLKLDIEFKANYQQIEVQRTPNIYIYIYIYIYITNRLVKIFHYASTQLQSE